MDAIVEKLKKEDLLVFDDGRYIMWAPGVEIPLTGKNFDTCFWLPKQNLMEIFMSLEGP